jgi:tetratricopeptide (TPR) repeat protein
MSPEQLRALPLTPRSDVFSFGIVLHEMLTGEHPFVRPTSPGTINAIMADAAPTPASAEHKIPPALLEIHGKALAKEPEDRYQSAAEIVADLAEVRQAIEPMKKTTHTVGIAMAIVLAAIVVVAGLRLLPRGSEPVPAEAPEPMSILIADFENTTGDEVFDGALEQALAIGLEEAPFVSSYKRGRARQVAEQIHGEEARLDAETARLVAQREAISVVVTGSIAEADPGYRVVVEAIDGLTGEPIISHDTQVRSKDQVLPAMARLTVRVRRALGDTVPESVELAAEETFTTASLEAARAYAEAQDLMAVGKWQEAAPVYRHAIQLDSEFGRAYAGLAVCYLNLNQLEDSKKYYEEAFARIDRMTDREKYRTRGGYYLLTRNYEKAAEEYEALVREYPSDPAGPSNLAFASFYGRDMPKALEIGRAAAEAHPEHVLTRANHALYAMYASDFETAAAEAEIVLEANPSYETAYVPAAMALIDQGDYAGASGIYDRLRQVSPYGASLAATGAADLALFQGRIEEAASLLERGIAGDRANELDAEAARKLMMTARAHMTSGDTAGAVTSTDQALSLARRRNVLFEAAVVFIEVGRTERALELSQELGGQLEPEPRVFSKLIEGRVALAGGEPQRALAFFNEAQALIDSWMGRYLLGRAYLDAGAYTEAYTEFETCVKRRGEVTSIHLDDVPSYHHFPEVYYYLGRSQEGLGSPAAANSYRSYLEIKADADSDARVADAHRRNHSPQ